MKIKIQLLSVAVAMFGFVACSKDNDKIESAENPGIGNINKILINKSNV